MINKIIEGIFNVIIFLANLILSPLESALNVIVPNLTNALGVVGDFLDTIIGYVPWVVSMLGLTPFIMGIISSLLTAIVMIPLTAHAIKIAVKWYNALKV